MRRMLLGVAWVVLATGLLLACGAAEEVEPGSQGFDPERSHELAEAYLGVAEEEVEETVMVRILRRGDERFAGTMDLRPGRLNLELDEDDDGVYRVSRVVVETEEGEDIVVE